jgi:hypothetical protein
MKVIIRIRYASSGPARSTTSRPGMARPERVRPFASNAPQARGFQPVAVWALTVLLMIGFMSVSMFATLSPVPEEIVQGIIDEDDPTQPIIGKVVTDCRIMLESHGKLTCLPSVEYREDPSGAVVVMPGSITRP